MAKILLIVEGAKTDVRLMKYLLDVYDISREHNIISYNANIYSLFNQMFKNGDPDEKYDNKLLQHQLNEIQESKQVFVVCTCVFYILDYDSKKIVA